jgi:transcriptional regulator with XRE-family HTH domain
LDKTALRKMREQRELSQKEVAAAANIDYQLYSKTERGIRKPQVNEAIRIARVLGCTVEEIAPEA